MVTKIKIRRGQVEAPEDVEAPESNVDFAGYVKISQRTSCIIPLKHSYTINYVGDTDYKFSINKVDTSHIGQEILIVNQNSVALTESENNRLSFRHNEGSITTVPLLSVPAKTWLKGMVLGDSATTYLNILQKGTL